MKRALIITLVFNLVFFTGSGDVHTHIKGDGVKTVVIDAGHGGIDPGNLGTGRYKATEKDIALKVALKLGKYIEDNFDDVKVVYTRKTDVKIKLKDRADIANKAEADLFISIHCDAFKNRSVHGSSSFVMGKNHDDENMRVAQQENSVIFLEENYEENYEGFDPNKPETYIALTAYQNAFLNQSISLAQKIQDQFRERVNRKDRGVKQQPLYVTSRTVMPAVLVELGFLTNKEEEDFLNSDKGQSYLASAIFRAFRDYKKERESFVVNPIRNTPTANTDIDKVTSSQDTPAKENKIIAQKPEAEGEVYYSVQIVTSGLKKELIPENFNGVKGVSFYKDGGLYKYIVGKHHTLETAEALKAKLKSQGFKDAFVVAIARGKRISLDEARNLLQ